jgi:hypothetical protein
MAIKIKSQTVFVDFEEYEGDTLLMQFAYKDPLGVLINLAGYSAKMDVRVSTDTAALLTLTSLDGIDLTGVTNNIVVTLTPSQTKTTLGVGDFVYDIEMTDTQNMVNTLISGKIKIKQSITQ